MRKHGDIHAGASETAKMLAYFPEEVDTKIAKTLKPSREFGPLGYWGDPASYDQIKSEEIQVWAEAVERLLVRSDHYKSTPRPGLEPGT